ncbi:MAG: hypothetical protein JF591_17645, partial [Lysobacter sp.]|nr:hypothetical protein [Lysobacter sp.]
MQVDNHSSVPQRGLAGSIRRMVGTLCSALIAASVLTLGSTGAHAQAPSATAAKPKALIVLSAASQWTRADGKKYDSGVWAEEFIVMEEKLTQAGFQVDLATPGGVAPTIDKLSLTPRMAGGEAIAEHFRQYLATHAARLAKPLVLKTVDERGYDAVIIPGGHGPVEDLYKDADMGRILLAANRSSKIIA